jgi:hypothetical protein
MTARFNQISNWVATVFVTTENLKQRVKILKKFIDIADHLRAMGNYNGFMEVFSALQRGPCRRLNKAFAVCQTMRMLFEFGFGFGSFSSFPIDLLHYSLS